MTRTAMLAAFFSLVVSVVSQAGTITIVERESSAENALFAGSGGAVQQDGDSDSTAAPTGPFSFSHSGSVQVLESDPLSNGSASASGSISVAENVAQPTAGSLSITATRTASSTAMWGSGTGTAQSYQSQELRVRFTVNGDDATYTLTGDFDPGVITTVVGEAHSLRLYRPFTANVLVDVDSAATLNEAGLLLAGRTYEFRILLNDRTRGSQSDPSNSDASNFDIQFNVQSVPEPSTWLLAALGVIAVLLVRRQS